MKRLIQKTKQFIIERPRIDWVFLGAGLGLFAVLALWHISNASIWFDEAFSAYITQFNFWDIARYTANDVHPPLYYWLLKLWEYPFGTSELALRSMSVLFGGVAITFAFLLMRRWFGRRAAWLTLLFLIVSPMLLRYAQEARMYTLVAAIALSATYVLSLAVESKKRWHWIVYGILVGLGMLTHYFTALIWIAHWAWRAITVWQRGVRGKEFGRLFFTRAWLVAHFIAIGVFLPWLPFLLYQAVIVQAGGFWIGSVSADTPTNYLTNVFYYLEHAQVQDWWALLLFVIIVGLVALAVRTYKRFGRKDKTRYMLIATLALVPVVTLLVLSMPPAQPTFVERYLVTASIAFMMFVALVIAVGLRKSRLRYTLVATVLVVTALIYGVANVYHYGNYNKNSATHIMTKELIQEIKQVAKPGEPIVADSPWIFYEAIFYNSSENPVYFIDENTQYLYGSLDMLKYNDQHKIKDLGAFAKEHPTIWYIGNTSADDVRAYKDSWQKIQTVGAFDPIDNKTQYRGTLYRID